MLYIIIEKHSGVLLNIYRCLSAAGYKVASNEFSGSESDNTTYVKLTIEDGALPLPPDIEGKILNIEGCLDIMYEKPALKNDTENEKSAEPLTQDDLKKHIKETAQKIINNFSDVANIVSDFTRQFKKYQVTNYIYFLGYEVGMIIYENDYSLGKPLKLELALKRMLAEAIKSFGHISCNSHVISIENNIFCQTADPDSHCDFTKGFMTGFLRSSPTTDKTKVENITCRSHGQNSCSFEFH